MISSANRRRFQAGVLGLTFAALLGGASVASAASQQSGDVIWMRVEVTKPGGDTPSVKVNLPLSLIEVVIDSIDKREFMAHIEDGHPSLDIPKLWRSIRKMEGEDFVTVETDDEHVRVWKQDELFRISVKESGFEKPNIQVKIPLSIMDYLFESRSSTFSFQDLVGELRGSLPLTLVSVDKDDEHIKIWLEER